MSYDAAAQARRAVSVALRVLALCLIGAYFVIAYLTLVEGRASPESTRTQTSSAVYEEDRARARRLMVCEPGCVEPEVDLKEPEGMGAFVNYSTTPVWISFQNPPTPWAPDTRVLGPYCIEGLRCPLGTGAAWSLGGSTPP